MSLVPFFYQRPPTPGVIVSGAGEADGLGAAPGIGASEVDSMAEADGVGAAPGIGFSTSTKTVVGWFDEWDKRRRIPVEQLNAILVEQGRTPFPVAAIEQKIATTKSPVLRKTLAAVMEEVSVRAEEPQHHWESITALLTGAVAATRTTAAIKQLERILAILREAEADDEEAVVLLLMENF